MSYEEPTTTPSASLPPAPPEPPVAPAPAAARPAGVGRFDVLALLLVASELVLLLSAFVVAWAQLDDQPTFAVGGIEGGDGLDELIRLAGSSAGLTAAGALLVALLLVTLGPPRPSPMRTLVLRSLTVLGLVTAGLGAVSAALTLTKQEQRPSSGTVAVMADGGDLLTRIGTVAPLLVAAVISVYVAWCAFSALGDSPPTS